MRIHSFLMLGTALVLVAACGESSIRQKSYSSAEEAAQALISAVRDGKMRGMLEVLGVEAKPVVDSGDSVQDANGRAAFLQAYDAENSLLQEAEGRVVLQVGADSWPFPFPIVAEEGRWRFDSSEGVEEVVNRRVGDNELRTIQACLAFVDAEREYYARNPENDPLLHYARKLLSSEGKRDGLYFEVNPGEPESPLGIGFANARDEGYFAEGAPRPEPFHGYVYRVLTAQGADAVGGAFDYLAGGKMIGGFALIAYPADYGNSGVMAFIINHDGIVFSKDLGAETAKVAGAITEFNPDSSWTREASI